MLGLLAPPSGRSASAPDDCPVCRAARARMHELEAAAAELRRELELGARRLRTALGQLAMAEERAGCTLLANANRAVASSARSGATLDVACPLEGRLEPASSAAAATAPRLGARERQVLRLITEGHRTPLIAERLGITVATVEVHRRNIMRKLDLHTVAGLTKYALREGLTFL